jgi:DNA-binding transcriptional LysR family regulator
MNNLAAIETFIHAADAGSFGGAAKALGISVPAVSKSMKTLESNLGVRLFARTTRGLTLTEDGQTYLDRVRPLLQEMQRAETELREAHDAVGGALRVSAPTGFGRHCIVPLLPDYLRHHPDVQVDLHLEDAFSDMVQGRFDVVVRNGRLEASNIVARQIAPMRLVVCGSPDYLARHGTPQTLADLAQHNCINYRLASSGKVFNWEFEQDGTRISLPVTGNLTVNSPEVTCFAALQGLGLAQLGTYHCAAPVRDGRLTPPLLDHICTLRGHWLCYLERRHLPQRVRTFADFVCNEVPKRWVFELPVN